jgi:hypothetical protein
LTWTFLNGLQQQVPAALQEQQRGHLPAQRGHLLPQRVQAWLPVRRSPLHLDACGIR